MYSETGLTQTKTGPDGFKTNKNNAAVGEQMRLKKEAQLQC
jgi:hypothetical protein